LLALRKAKLNNNCGYVHLALRFENPFGDRSITIIPKEFALRWQMPESSVYEAMSAPSHSTSQNICYLRLPSRIDQLPAYVVELRGCRFQCARSFRASSFFGLAGEYLPDAALFLANRLC